MEKISLIIKEFGIFVLIGVVGIGLIVYALWSQLKPEDARVEIVKNQDVASSNQSGQVVVDLAGAVEKPGVYKMPPGSRIGDVLVAGGGLASTADREWVAKTLNLAEEVKDGHKVYIPEKQTANPVNQNITELPKASGKVNINTASLTELDSLEGIGEVRARLIMDNRPYGKIEELMSKAKIPETVYEKIKDKITIY